MHVTLPPRITNRVLVSFLDDEGQPLWTKILAPNNVTVDAQDFERRMTLDLNLLDIYRNET